MPTEKEEKKIKKTAARLPRPASPRRQAKTVSEEATPKEGVEAEKKTPTASRYFETVGRRKTAVARVRLFVKSDKGFLVNGQPLEKYFTISELAQTASAALTRMNSEDKFSVEAQVKGGGSHAQAEAIRHGTARALVLFNEEFRKRLKRAGFLTRDSRMRERKKFGLKRARRAPQWHKR